MLTLRSSCSRKTLTAGAVIVALQVVGAMTFGVSATGSWVSNVCQLCCNVLAVLSALCAARRASAKLRSAWYCIAAGLTTWTASNVSWTYQVNWIGGQVPESSLTNLGFVVFGIPLGLALIVEDGEGSRSAVPWLLDVFQFVLLGILLFVEICYLPRLNPSRIEGLSGDLVQIELVACIFLLAAFLLRSLYARTAEFCDLYRRVAFFLGTYTLLRVVPPITTGIVWYLPSGAWYGLSFSVPFVAGAIAISGWRPDSRLVAETPMAIVRTPMASAAASFVPALVPIVLLTLGAVVEEQSRPLAIVIGSLSLAAFGLRFVLMQGERERAQRALEDSERLYRAMFEDAPYALFRAATDGDHFLSVNGALVSLLGYESAPELLAASLTTEIFTNSEEKKKLIQSTDRNLRCQTEVKWLRKNGDRIDVRLTGRLIRDVSRGGVDIMEVAAEDVSETRRLQNQLLHAQKMESIGTLAGGVAHDFNNILMITSAYSEMLETDLAEQPQLQACATEIRKAVVRASAITSQLLAFSRKQQVNPVVIDAGAEIAELRPMLQRLCGEDVKVVVERSAEPIVIEVDRGQFAQVMINLAANARDAMPQGGKITIVSSVEGGAASIVFSDTGVGMPESVKSKIFEPFFTTKDVGKGTGLGLATVYGIVKSTGGDIRVESQTGQGTTFRLLFPLLDRARLGCANQALHDGNGARGTILIADDEGALCSAICDYLESKGHAVFVSRNGQDALRIARELPHVDVLLSDVAMPGMRGPELARSLKTLHPEARVLLMTGHNEVGEVSEVCADAELLMKPIALAELDQRISRLIVADVTLT